MIYVLLLEANMMRTEVCFEPSEFEWYKVDSPTIITFCLKELRAAVMFAEPANLPISMAFNAPGT
jgi:cell cycle checkpoint control protein RAD9A